MDGYTSNPVTSQYRLGGLSEGGASIDKSICK